MPVLNLVFLGSDPIALPLLEWLIGAGSTLARVRAVFTQPDRPVGRGQKIAANAIKLWAQRHGIAVYQPEKLRAEALGDLESLRADVSLVMAYGHILREEFINASRLGTLNLHASLLPKYRGASPIQTAVAMGERETGVSLMRIVRELDAGPVAASEHVPITPYDTALEVEAKLAAACVPLLARTLPALAEGRLKFQEQIHAEATFCRRLTKADGVLDFNNSAGELAARINGLFPWPACGAIIGGQSIKFGLADAIKGQLDPGKIGGCDGEGLLIGSGAGVLRVLRLQRPGGRMLPASEFMRGVALPQGTVLGSRSMAVLSGSMPFHA